MGINCKKFGEDQCGKAGLVMDDFKDKYQFSNEEWEACLKVLRVLKDQPFNNPSNPIFASLITKIHKKAKKEQKQRKASQQQNEVLKAINKTTIVNNANNGISYYGEESNLMNAQFKELQKSRNCYACNKPYTRMHSFYHRLCPSCATLNFSKRSISIDLQKRNVILTGGRIKVGYATALKLLRSNANLLITTRFPALALDQFKKETDFLKWESNLHVYGLDLRNLKEVEKFIDHYKSNFSSLDILINNAAQTIKYNDDYYDPLIKKEQTLLLQDKKKYLYPNQDLKTTALPFKGTESFKMMANRFGQPIDERSKTSWNSTLEEIDMVELLEVNLINQISPYLLIKELKPLMEASNFLDRFIINVTSSEGQFSYDNKTKFHPHTNMTKAALNMMTLTSAKDFVEKNIFMNAVDVGWISTGANEALRKKQFAKGYIPPLDSVDGAARIIHPIYEQIENKKTIYGKLIKNYEVVNW